MYLLLSRVDCFSFSFCLFLFLVLGSTVRAVIKLPDKLVIPGVIVFGDSIVDTGNNNYIDTVFKVNYPPYGKDFAGGEPTGRFCDGKVPADLLVEELGIKELLPPYLDPTLRTRDLKTGVNFASGGAGFDPLTSELATVISLEDQIEFFQEYVEKLKVKVGKAETSNIVNNSLYIVVAGSNDITNTYFNNPIRRLNYDPRSYVDLMLDSASSFLQDLYELGARRIGVFGVPPIGCLPSQRTLTGGLERKCVENYNQMAQMFNARLIALIGSLNFEFSLSRIVYIDVYDIPLDIIFNPNKYGFEIGDRGCCGTGAIEVAFLCKYTCNDVSDYVFWDSFHLTEKAYRVLVHEFLLNQINSFL